MAYNSNGSTVQELTYNTQIADISTASVAHVPVLRPGRIMDAAIAISAAITVADSVVTVKKFPAGVSANTVTIGTITVATSGSADGKSYSLVITGNEAACTFAAGDVLVFDNAAGSSTTSIGRCSAILR
jgi:hypothetical protein